MIILYWMGVGRTWKGWQRLLKWTNVHFVKFILESWVTRISSLWFFCWAYGDNVLNTKNVQDFGSLWDFSSPVWQGRLAHGLCIEMRIWEISQSGHPLDLGFGINIFTCGQTPRNHLFNKASKIQKSQWNYEGLWLAALER